MNSIIIREETPSDYKKTEYMVMRAFWNLHGPGCNEHLLVHKLRDASCYQSSLSRVAEMDGKIVGAIFYADAIVRDGDREYKVLLFGPLCVEPTLQQSGVGRKLLEETIPLARKAGYPGIVILGEPWYYPKFGFVPCENFGITLVDGSTCDAFMAYVLDKEAFSQVHGKFIEDSVYESCDNSEELEQFTRQFPYHKPLTLSCQWLHEEKLGRVCEVQKNRYRIRFWEKELPARLGGNMRKEGQEIPVVGDYVTFCYNPSGESVITAVCERKSLLKRPDQAGHAIAYVKNMQEQTMVANFDYAFIVASLNGNYNVNRIARYIAVVLQGGGIPVVLLTKSDLCSNPARYIKEIEELSDRVRVHVISALYGIGIPELQQYLKPGNTVAILGSSGVGKSTLVNALVGEEVMKTSAIRETDAKGRHTTTYRQLIVLPNQAEIMDTPGMRELGMCDVKEGIDETFTDIAKLEMHCKFRNCRHESEPGCAIKAAIAQGTLAQERFDLYQKLHTESDKAAKMKTIAKARKNLKKFPRK